MPGATSKWDFYSQKNVLQEEHPSGFQGKEIAQHKQMFVNELMSNVIHKAHLKQPQLTKVLDMLKT